MTVLLCINRSVATSARFRGAVHQLTDSLRPTEARPPTLQGSAKASDYHVFSFKIMLPESQHRPSIPSQSSSYQLIARNITGNLGRPVRYIARRTTVVSRAAMPKTTVNHHRNTCSGKSEVGCAEDLQLPAPSNQMCAAQNGHHPPFGRRIASTLYCSHDRRSLDSRHERAHRFRIANKNNPIIKQPRQLSRWP